MNIWTLINKTRELGSMSQALEELKPTRRQCDVIDGQRQTVAMRIMDALENHPFRLKASQDSIPLIHPEHGELLVNMGCSDDDYIDFIQWIPSQGEDVCRQLVSNPGKLLPDSGNWSLFAPQTWRGENTKYWGLKTDEDFWYPLEEYYIKNFIRPKYPDYPDLEGEIFLNTSLELPLDGFLSRPPAPYSIKHNAYYESYINALLTEESAQEMYAKLGPPY
jgi:hypothetical protein